MATSKCKMFTGTIANTNSAIRNEDAYRLPSKCPEMFVSPSCQNPRTVYEQAMFGTVAAAHLGGVRLQPGCNIDFAIPCGSYDTTTTATPTWSCGCNTVGTTSCSGNCDTVVRNVGDSNLCSSRRSADMSCDMTDSSYDDATQNVCTSSAIRFGRSSCNTTTPCQTRSRSPIRCTTGGCTTQTRSSSPTLCNTRTVNVDESTYNNGLLYDVNAGDIPRGNCTTATGHGCNQTPHNPLCDTQCASPTEFGIKYGMQVGHNFHGCYDPHGLNARYAHDYRLGPYNPLEGLNGWANTFNDYEYNCATECGTVNRNGVFFKPMSFCFYIETKAGAAWEEDIAGATDPVVRNYCLAVNGAKSRTLHMHRGCRYYIFFKFVNNDRDYGEQVTDPTVAAREKLYISTYPKGGNDAQTFCNWGPWPLGSGGQWIDIPRHAPEVLFYCLSDSYFTGGIIKLYGGEGMNY